MGLRSGARHGAAGTPAALPSGGAAALPRGSRPVAGRLVGRPVARCAIAAAALAAAWRASSGALLGWVSGHFTTRLPHHLGAGLIGRSAAADDLEGVVLVPVEEDFGTAEDFTPVQMLRPKEEEKPAGGKAPAKAKKKAKRPLLAAAKGSSQTDGEGAAAGGKKKKKRWLAGRGNAKRRKLDQNNALVNWLVQNGVWISDKADWGREAASVQIAVETREAAENEVSGRGVVAARDVNLYEELARVPMSILFSRESSRKKFGPEAIYPNMSEYAAIALHLISEKSQEEASSWGPYLDILPTTEEVGASFAWQREEVEALLGGSPLMNMTLFLREKLEAEYAMIQQRVLSAYPDKFPADIFTLERYIWAYSILFSRAVRLTFPDIGQIIALVPYIDLINHSPNSQTYIKGISETTQLPFGLSDTERYVIVKADRYYNQYEQIYISYGEKSNAELLMLYGFSMERNTDDFVEMSMSWALDDAPLGKVKRRLLDERGIKYDNFPLYRDRFVQPMLMFSRLVVVTPEDLGLTEEEAEDEERAYEALSQLDVVRGFSEAPETKAMLKLREIFEEALNGYVTTIEEDERLVEDRAMFELLPRNQRNALRVRYQEKIILRNSLNTIDKILNNVKTYMAQMDEEARKEEELRNTPLGRLGLKWDPAYGEINSLEDIMRELDI